MKLNKGIVVSLLQKINRSLISVDGKCIALGICPDEFNYGFSYQYLSSSLYDGYLGIIIMVLVLENDNEYADLLLEAEDLQVNVEMLLKAMINHLEYIVSSSKQISHLCEKSIGLNGLSELFILYKLTKKFCHNNKNILAMKALIESLFPKIKLYIYQSTVSEDCSIMTGYAGLLGAIINIENQYLDDLSVFLGERIACLQSDKGGWKNDFHTSLTGFSHGSAGIVAALSRLYQKRPSQPVLEAIIKALCFQKNEYSTLDQIWPDNRFWRKRNQIAGGKHINAWCHGAPGILLSTIICFQNLSIINLKDAYVWDSIKITYNSIRSCNFEQLCCGSGGSTFILNMLANSNIPLSTKTERLCEHSKDIYLDTINTRYQCGLLPKSFPISSSNLLHPSFFLGASGILMLYLSLTSDKYKDIMPTILSSGIIDLK
ncbi:lanthionine synthetase LanC family protein [Synechococcus sp. MIT S1220]|uniref:lanthionine synthetase LanC family protein n=1 Tax=Synechococcus sp. MIT S1220 TaxID=3082549 RepID=UPI0039AFA489